MEEQRQTLCRQLDTVDTSMGFLGLLIVSLGLSWKAVALQREGLCGALRGESGEAPDTFFLRLPASAIVVGALTCFFRLALDAWEQSCPPAAPPRSTCGPPCLCWRRPCCACMTWCVSREAGTQRKNRKRRMAKPSA